MTITLIVLVISQVIILAFTVGVIGDLVMTDLVIICRSITYLHYQQQQRQRPQRHQQPLLVLMKQLLFLMKSSQGECSRYVHNEIVTGIEAAKNIPVQRGGAYGPLLQE